MAISSHSTICLACPPGSPMPFAGSPLAVVSPFASFVPTVTRCSSKPLAPTILNGIEDIVCRSDLADRAIFITLEPMADERRRTERELWGEFEAMRPCILGALLDAAAHGLRGLSGIRLERPPRMADFALWATACETAFWPPGTFLRAYNANRSTW